MNHFFFIWIKTLIHRGKILLSTCRKSNYWPTYNALFRFLICGSRLPMSLHRAKITECGPEVCISTYSYTAIKNKINEKHVYIKRDSMTPCPIFVPLFLTLFFTLKSRFTVVGLHPHTSITSSRKSHAFLFLGVYCTIVPLPWSRRRQMRMVRL